MGNMGETDALLIEDSEQEFVFSPDNLKVNFRSLSEVEKHISAEVAYWEKVDSRICNYCREARQEARRIKSQFAGQAKIPHNQLARLKDMLRYFSFDGNGIRACIYSKSRLGRYLSEMRSRSQNDDDYYRRAFAVGNAIVGGTSWNMPNTGLAFREGVMGLVSLRGEEWLANIESQYSDRIREFDEQNLYRQETLKKNEQRLEKIVADNLEDAEKRQKEFQQTMTGFGKTFDTLADERRQDYDEFYALASDRLNALEETYEEKLQLAAPAECWKKLSSHYFWCGVVELVAAAAIGIALGVFVFLLLDNKDAMPWLNSGKVDFTTVRTAILLLIMTSAFGYVVHFLGRMSISSFHLSRDYSERYQLTCVYLAMKRDASDGKSENVKSVVYQSLFSRSDTGLLKGDHAMKMPTVTELIKPKES